ncbi:hypothetical protein GCM10027191_08250 [Novilysobacter erysipheiresistens]
MAVDSNAVDSGIAEKTFGSIKRVPGAGQGGGDESRRARPGPGTDPKVIRTTPAFGLAQNRECSRLPVRHGQRPSVLTHDPGRCDAALQSARAGYSPEE